MSAALSTLFKTPLHSSFGGGAALWWPCSRRPKVFVLFIPGNPGTSSYYIPYLTSMYNSPELKDQVEILALSHRGHAPISTTSGSFAAGHEEGKLADETDTSLPAQIIHKVKAVEAVRRIYPKTKEGSRGQDDVKLVIIGHSVGAYIGLHVLEKTRDLVDGLQLLFPTVMHIAKAPKARTIPLLLATNTLVQRFILPLPLFFLSLLPAFALLALLRVVTGMPAAGIQTTLEFLLTPGAPLNAARMARQEFDSIKDMTPEIARAVKTLRARHGSVRSYWSKGDQDTWAPEGHRRDLESALLLTRIDLPPHLNASPSDISRATKSASLRSRTLAMGGTITRAAGRRLIGRTSSNWAHNQARQQHDGMTSPPPPTPSRPGIVPTSPAARTQRGAGSGTLSNRRTPRRRPSVSLATAKRSFDGTITLELPQGQDWGFLDSENEERRETGGVSSDDDDGQQPMSKSHGTAGGNNNVADAADEDDVFGPGGRIDPPHHSPPEVKARTDLARHKTRQGEVTSTVCQLGMPHAFCLKYGQEMGVISSWWIANDFL